MNGLLCVAGVQMQQGALTFEGFGGANLGWDAAGLRVSHGGLEVAVLALAAGRLLRMTQGLESGAEGQGGRGAA